jgi:hypothetical protein
MDNKNKNEDFEVIISNLDGANILLTENAKDKITVDEMWNRVLEQSAYNFQSKKHLYSTNLKDNSYNSSNEVTVEDIEEYSKNPQNDLSTIQKINQIVKSFVNKDDVIGRVYECIQMYINTSYNLIFNNGLDEKDEKKIGELQKLVENFNDTVNVKKFLKQGVPSSYLNGTYVTYLRNTKDGNYTIDVYPIGVVEISEFTVDDEPVVLFNVNSLKQKLKPTSRKNKKGKDILFENAERIVKANYPAEVYKAYMNNEKYVVLDQKRVGVVRINNLDGLYGLTPIFKALKPAIVLNNIEQTDDSTVKARGKKIIHQKLRKEIAGVDYQKQALNEMTYAHENFVEAWRNKTVVVTTPWWVESIEYVEPQTDTTNKDTLNTYRNKEFTSLGISFLDTYNATLDVSKISLDGLMKYIDAIVGQFADIINKYYRVLFENNRQDIGLCPKIQVKCAESMSMEMKKSIAEFMFTKLSASYETCYDVLGVSNAKTEAIRRTKEEKAGFNKIFKPHESYFTQTGNGDSTNNGGSDDKQAGRPSGEETHKQQYDKEINDLKSKGG